MTSFIIRPATPSDEECIVDFNLRLAEETEGKTLDRAVLESGVAALLSNPDKGRYFVAEAASGQVIGQVIGQVMITYEWSDWRNGLFWWLQSVYVAKECRQQGVFSALFDHIAQLASEEPQVCGIRLYVDKENAPAQATYGARGFERANYEVMELVFTETP